VQGLSKLIGDHAPCAVKTQKFENFFGRKIAVDASMCMYQFLVRLARYSDPNILGNPVSWRMARALVALGQANWSCLRSKQGNLMPLNAGCYWATRRPVTFK
jgi:hypothetical protein